MEVYARRANDKRTSNINFYLLLLLVLLLLFFLCKQPEAATTPNEKAFRVHSCT